MMNNNSSNCSSSICSNSDISSSCTMSSYHDHPTYPELHLDTLLQKALGPFKFYTSLPLLQHFETQPEHIDELIAIEMQHIQDHFAEEEQRYVEQMLAEHPVVVERRASPNTSMTTATSEIATTAATAAAATATTTTATAAVGATTSATATTKRTSKATKASKKASSDETDALVQQQRAESCRKSRYNNKIKKAKMRFRHKFIEMRVSERKKVLDYINGVILQTEKQLLDYGYSQATLDKLRHKYGVDRLRAKIEMSDKSELSGISEMSD